MFFRNNFRFFFIDLFIYTRELRTWLDIFPLYKTMYIHFYAESGYNTICSSVCQLRKNIGDFCLSAIFIKLLYPIIVRRFEIILE